MSKRMTYLDLVKNHFPEADDKFADFVLWEKTAFPLVKDAKTIEEQIMEFAEESKK
jgi:hypothetical protein